MFIVHFYTALLFIFTGFLNNTYAMVIHSNKNQSHHRSERQLRPVLNGIIFLLAANLVAKGTLALGGFQTPNIPNNVQGSLYLTLNGPQQNPNLGQQNNPIWYPISNQVPFVGLTTQRPITQQQIVNIRDPYYEDVIEEASKPNPIQKIIINRFNNLDDVIPAASEEVNVKLDGKKARLNEENSGNSSEESTEYYVDDVELLPDAKQAEEDIEDDNGKQQVPTTATTSTTRQTQRTTQTTLGTESVVTTPSTTTANSNKTAGSNQGYTFGYGPSNGYENVSITTEAPARNNMTAGNVSDTLQPPPNNGTANNPGTLYGPPNVYGPPSNTFGPPSNTYGPPSNTYGPPSNTYGPPSNTYGPPNIHDSPNTHGPLNTYGLPNMYGPPHVGPHFYPSGQYGSSNGNENISIAYGPPGYQKPFFSSPEDPYLNNYYNNYYDSPSYYSGLYKYSDVFNKFYNRYQYNYPSFYNNYLGK